MISAIVQDFPRSTLVDCCLLCALRWKGANVGVVRAPGGTDPWARQATATVTLPSTTRRNGRQGGTAPLLKQVFCGLEEAGGVLTEAAIVVLRLGGLIVPTGGPWGWVFCGRRWLPGSVALAPPSEGKDGSGQQPEDSYPAGFFPGDEDDAEGKKSTAGSV